PFEIVYSFTIDQQGNYWVCGEAGLYKGEANEFGSLTWSNLSELSGLEGQNFISLYMDSEGNIWAGTYGFGVYKFSAAGERIINYQTSNGLFDNNVIHISGNDSLIFFSTLGGGVSTYHTGLNRIINFQDETLNHSYIYATKDDNQGKVWIAGSLGSPAYISEGEVIYLLQTDYNFPQLYGIAIDSSGNAWFNTNDKGILLFLNDTIREYGTGQGITFKEIQSIIFDKLNNLVIISNQGIKFFKPGSGVIMEFGENTGLAYRYPILNSVFTDKQGQIWIGTETGIIKYNPDYLDQISDTPKIFLSTVKLYNTKVTRSGLKFRYNENNFTFEYTGLWFKNPEVLSYRYKLEGYDLNWTYSDLAQPFTYSKLPPGKFDFRAQVSIDGKTWTGSEDASFSFTIKPPFWKTWWFISAVVILIILGIYVYIRMRLAYLQRTKKELEEEVNRRTEEIRTQNEELETQKEEIEAQRDMAQQQRDQIEVQNEEIQASIRYAHRIQSAALPPKSNLDEILGEHFILNKPRDIVSGDFYWVAQRNGHIFFAVGDCTGHGVPGAFMSMLGMSALNDIVKSIDQFKASTMLTYLSNRIRESLHQGPSGHETSSMDGMDISLCIYEPASGALQYAGAYNSLYIINNGEIRNIRADNLSIGSDMEGSTGYTNHDIKTRKGDQLYLFSDGFPDQFGGPRGKKYKYQQFREFLLSIHKETMERQKWLMDEEIEAWCIGYPKVDDILVMGVKIE
ncbi:MAG: SpoIIE family protein phosphatase, partial [Bacteroidales bacterium]